MYKTYCTNIAHCSLLRFNNCMPLDGIVDAYVTARNSLFTFSPISSRKPNRLKYSCVYYSEVGTNNIISKAQRNKAQRSFQPAKAQRKMRNLIFLLSEVQRNFRNELFDSVEAQRNSAIAERYFRTKLKRNLTSAIEISQHNANTAFFVISD